MRKIAIIICLSMLFVAFFQNIQVGAKTGSNSAQEPVSESMVIKQSAIPMNEETLTAFLDEFIMAEMERHHIAGALVAAVDNQAIIASRGYGYANIEENRIMEPADAVFRAASISKLFTATALMQLVEKGLIDLDTDINEYLGAGMVPAVYNKPITAAHLLTHTSGFDERFLKVRFSDSQRITGLYEDVIGSMPPRVRPPGEVVSYSNYGYALLGYLVEVVSGVEFETYIEENIFKPLNMNHSTFQEPPGGALLDKMVTMYSYSSSNNQHTEFPTVYHNQRPAGALYSNIEDLAKFAMMQLNGGMYRDVSILGTGTVENMQAVQTMHHPRLEGRGYGFYEIHKKGLRIIGHDGDLSGAHTYLFLIPEVNFGMIFHFNTSINTSIQEDPRRVLVEHFMDTFYPDASLSQPTVEKNLEATAVPKISGYYRITRYAKSSPGKLLNPNILIQFVVTQERNGKVSIVQPLGMATTTVWAPYTNELFYQADTGELLAYSTNSQGKVDYLYLNQGGPMTLERIPWYEGFWVVLALLTLPQLVFISIILGGLALKVYRRRKRKQSFLYSSEARWSSLLVKVISIVGIATFGSLIAMILQVMQNLDSPLLFMLPVISLAGWILGISSIILMMLNIRLYQRMEIKKCYSILYSLCVIAGLSFTWILYYGNLLKFATA